MPRTLAALAALAALALPPAGCGEAHHYSVDMNGNTRRVDKDGNPLPPGQDALGGDATAGGSGAMDALAADGGNAAGGSLRGTISLKPDLGVTPEAYACVFVIVRHDPKGSADFVKKIDHPQFPLDFVITTANSMVGATSFSGAYQVFARLDADGDATPQRGDVQGAASTAAVSGGPPVSIVLDQLVATDGQPPRLDAPMAGGGMPSSPASPAPSAPFAPFAGGAAAAASPEEVAAAEAGPHIDGTVDIDPAFAALQGKGRLFIFVRSAQAEGGMPIAVVPVDAPRFPHTFRISTLNVALDVDNKADMLSGQLRITARLSLSGTAKAAPGDVECEPKLVKAGDKVALRLTRKIGS